MSAPPVISAVIPVHNEEGFIDGALPDLVKELDSIGASFEVLVAENGSSDRTAEIAERHAADDSRIRVIRLAGADYGAAMRAGFLDATGAWVVNFDIDYFSGTFVAQAIELDADVVLASKRVDGADDQRSAFRRLGTWGFNLILRLLLSSRVTDTHGMKAVRRHVVEQVVPTVRSTQDLFDTELVIRAERAGHAVAEIPAVVQEMREARSSFVSRIPRTLRGLWRIRRQLAAEARSA